MRTISRREAIERSSLSESQYAFHESRGLLPLTISVAGGRKKSLLEHELDAVVSLRAIGGTDDEVRALIQRLVQERLNLIGAAPDDLRNLVRRLVAEVTAPRLTPMAPPRPRGRPRKSSEAAEPVAA